MGARQPHRALVEVAAGRDLPPVADAGELVRSAAEHRMSGLLWTAWSHGPRPERYWLDLTVSEMRRRERQARLWATLADITVRIGELGVELATAKGVTAEARWYRGPGERPCSDVDLLVKPADFGRARDIVAALDPANIHLPHLDKLVSGSVVQSIDLLVGGVPVDLHFDIFKLGIPCRQRQLIWERTTPFALDDGIATRVLDPEIALIHFLLHLNKDRFRYLLGFADVARLLQQEDLDWRFIREFAQAEGLHVPISLALGAVLDTLGLAPVGRRESSDFPAPACDGTSGGPEPADDARAGQSGRSLPRPAGWRAVVWQVAWRPAVRLQGDLGVVRFRHRQELLGLLAPGRAREALWLWARRFLFPPLVFVDVWYPDIRGPYLWRLAKGRGASNWPRLRALPSRVRSRLRPAGPT